MENQVRPWKGNLGKMIQFSKKNWALMHDSSLIYLTAKAKGRKLVEGEHEFINMVSCDYLGISSLAVVNNEIRRILDEDMPVNLSVSSVRIQSSLLKDVESRFENLYDIKCLISLSASEASSALLPLLASGYFHDFDKPVMVFDKQAHFSLKYIAPICMNETLTLEIDKDNMQALEIICRENENVVYVTDSVYSLGGESAIDAIIELQKKYNLYVVFDEAHSTSIYGDHGEGLIRPKYKEFPKETFIISSFNKAFGAAGGAIFMSKEYNKHEIKTLAGPLGWSQCISNPVLAAIKGALTVHESGYVRELQAELRKKLQLFDEKIKTKQSGSLAPIRIIPTKSLEDTKNKAKFLFENGYYLAPVYFPIVPKDTYGMRVMLRADLQIQEIDKLILLLGEIND